MSIFSFPPSRISISLTIRSPPVISAFGLRFGSSPATAQKRPRCKEDNISTVDHASVNHVSAPPNSRCRQKKQPTQQGYRPLSKENAYESHHPQWQAFALPAMHSNAMVGITGSTVPFSKPASSVRSMGALRRYATQAAMVV